MTGVEVDEVDEVLPAGVCVCGRVIPPESPSDWSCRELCQSAWMMWRANPDYPHPREIRAAADRALRVAAGQASTRRSAVPPPADGGLVSGPDTVEQGTEIDVDGVGFVRVGVHWQQTGPWSQRHGELAEALEYQRWCPTCRCRQGSELHQSLSPDAPPGWQQCTTCGYQWPGRPLVGVVETRGDPWPGIRLRLTDGFRSTTRTVSEDTLAVMSAGGPEQVVVSLARHWIRLERHLSGGYADQDPASESARARGRARMWDWRGTDQQQTAGIHRGGRIL